MALSLYLYDAGIRSPEDQYLALNRQIAQSWFGQLQRAGLAQGLDVFDVVAGKDALIAELIMQMPTGSGKSNPALLSLERPTPALLAVQP